MFSFKNSLNQIRDKIFTQIHSNNLIYNTCWEDPRCDREMLHINKSTRLVMITSAGCNALDYLLDNPKEIHCIDMNARQNAVLALKIALFQHGSYEDLWLFFGEGHHPNAVSVYAEKLKMHLPDYAQEFWDKNIIYFTKKQSFYFFGTSGTFAWWFNQYINSSKSLRGNIDDLLDAKNIEEQREIYQKVEPKIVSPFVKWVMNRHITMSMLGVPRAQRQLIVDEYDGGVSGFIQNCLRQVFMELPTEDNYFWRLYLTGKYTPACCPNYLRPENYEILRERTSNIHLHTTTVSQFLIDNPSKYTHYILLDHQDWLAAHDVPALTDEWNHILKNSKKDTKILLRSAALRVDFFPDFVNEAIKFDEELMQRLHKLDRVGTYASVYFGKVK